MLSTLFASRGLFQVEIRGDISVSSRGCPQITSEKSLWKRGDLKGKGLFGQILEENSCWIVKNTGQNILSLALIFGTW